MEIIRNGVAIKLTNAEIRAAYDLYRYECQLEDAKRYFGEWAGDRFADEEQFVRRYGFTEDEACCSKSANYKLDKIVQVFNDKYNSGDSEEYIWSVAINEVMSALPTPSNK